MTTKHAEEVEYLKSFAESIRNDVIKDEVQAQFIFFSESCNDGPRIYYFPDLSEREKAAVAVNLLSGAISDLTRIGFLSDTFASTIPPEFTTKPDGTTMSVEEIETLISERPELLQRQEALNYTVVSKDGVCLNLSLPYDRLERDVNFRVNEMTVYSSDEGVDDSGFWAVNLRNAFGAPKLEDYVEKHGASPEDFNLDRGTARLHILAMAAKLVMMQTERPCAIPTYSEEEVELVRRTFKVGPMAGHFNILTGEEVEEVLTLEEQFDAPAFGETPEE
jgi:hypothetical protein